MRDIIIEAQVLEAIIDVLEHTPQSPLSFNELVESTADYSEHLLMLCAACTRVATVLLADPSVRQEYSEEVIYTRLVAAMFGCGAPAHQVCLLVLELVLWKRISEEAIK